MREELDRILEQHCGQNPFERVNTDGERDYFMSVEESRRNRYNR